MRLDPGQYPFVRDLEDGFETIRDEVMNVREEVWLPWTEGNALGAQVIPLRMPYLPPSIDDNFDERRAQVPRTWKFLAQRPELYTAVLSKLVPGGRILPHCDMEEPDSLRCHLPLSLPADNAASFRVGDDSFSWTEGRCVVFHASTEHEGRNDGDAPRIVLIVDVRDESHGK